MIPDYLQKALFAQFPDADFTPYFAFIESLPQADDGHRHHILPKREFPEFSKDPSNLIRLSPADHFRAHYWLAVCAFNYEPFQIVFYLMTNRKRTYRIPVDELDRYAEVYERGRVKQIEASRKRGLKYVETGQLDSIRDLPQTKEAQRKTGLIRGRKAVESGLLARMQSMGGRIGGRINGPINGRINGRKAVESGQLASIRSKGGHIGGHINGHKNAENGTLEKARHSRWHVKRGIVKQDCTFCVNTLETSHV
jgi:hypothetical protein